MALENVKNLPVKHKWKKIRDNRQDNNIKDVDT
jgi:hypothetical protein